MSLPRPPLAPPGRGLKRTREQLCSPSPALATDSDPGTSRLEASASSSGGVWNSFCHAVNTVFHRGWDTLLKPLTPSSSSLPAKRRRLMASPTPTPSSSSEAPDQPVRRRLEPDFYPSGSDGPPGEEASYPPLIEIEDDDRDSVQFLGERLQQNGEEEGEDEEEEEVEEVGPEEEEDEDLQLLGFVNGTTQPSAVAAQASTTQRRRRTGDAIRGGDKVPPPRQFRVTTSAQKQQERYLNKPGTILKRLKERHPGQTHFARNFRNPDQAERQQQQQRSSQFASSGRPARPPFYLRALPTNIFSKPMCTGVTTRRGRRQNAIDECIRLNDLQMYSSILKSNVQPVKPASRGLNSPVTPAGAGAGAAGTSSFTALSSGAITRTQVVPSEAELAARRKRWYQRMGVADSLSSKSKSQSMSTKPEVIDLAKDEEAEVVVSSLPVAVTSSASSASSARPPKKKQGEFNLPLLESRRPHAKGKDDDIIDILDQYAPKVPLPKEDPSSGGSNLGLGRVTELSTECRLRPVCKDDFLQTLKEKYDVSARERRRKVREQTVVLTHVRERTKQIEDSVEERLKQHLNITEVALEEDEEEEEAEEEKMPEITSEMEQVIERACKSRGETLVDAFNISISRKDIDTLKGLNWLNDEIINFYMQMIGERSKTTDNWPNVYAFNTFFYPKVVQSGHGVVRRWTRKIDLFSFDLVLIPVHLGLHWCLATIDFRKPGIYYYDSMGGGNGNLHKLLQYVKDEYKDKKKSSDYDVSNFELQCVKDIPQQMNGSDCGMFTCKFAEYLSRNASFSFGQEDMPYFRRRMIHEIVQNKLLHP